MDQVENPLNKSQNTSVAANRRLAQIDVEGEREIALHTLTHTHTRAHSCGLPGQSDG